MVPGKGAVQQATQHVQFITYVNIEYRDFQVLGFCYTYRKASSWCGQGQWLSQGCIAGRMFVIVARTPFSKPLLLLSYRSRDLEGRLCSPSETTGCYRCSTFSFLDVSHGAIPNTLAEGNLLLLPFSNSSVGGSRSGTAGTSAVRGPGGPPPG